MDEISRFRGLAGEVIVGFVQPRIFLTAIPVLLYWLVVLLALFFIGWFMPAPLDTILILAAASFLIARFALPARQGELQQGFFGYDFEAGELTGFVLRYLVLTISWSIPLALISWGVIGGSVQTYRADMQGLANPNAFAHFGFAGLLMGIIWIISMLAPAISVLVTLYCDSVGEIFSAGPWSWLYHERRQDLVPFFASLFGGIFVFWAIYLIPMLIIVVIVSQIAAPIAGILAVFIMTLPIATAPVLLGRLAGAFVLGEDDLQTIDDTGADTPIAPAPDGARRHTTTKPQAAACDIAQIKAEIATLATADYAAHAAKLKQRLQAQPNDIAAHASQAYCLMAQDDPLNAHRAAGQAIGLLIDGQRLDQALILFHDFAESREHLQLSTPHLIALSQPLTQQADYATAAWCIYVATMLADSQEAIGLQKQLLAIADAAAHAGHPQAAQQTYQFFVEKFPQSSFADYARNAAEEIARKL